MASFDNGETINSFYPIQKVLYKLTTDEANSGIVNVSVFSNTTADVGFVATVASALGSPRTLTKVLNVTASGVVSIEGSSFAAGDLVTLLGFKYFDID